MSTKKQKKVKHGYNRSKIRSGPSYDTKTDVPLTELLSVMQSVDTKSKEAKQNEESMTDSEGNQIWYNWLWKFGRDAEKKKDKDNRK